MLKLKEWFFRYAALPFIRLFIFVIFLQCIYFSYLIHANYKNHLERIEHISQAVTLGVQQSNRPLIESAMSSFLLNSDIIHAALCNGSVIDISYPLSDNNYCNYSRHNIWRWVIKKPLIGVEGYYMVIVISPLISFSNLIFLTLITVITLILVILTIFDIYKRVKNKILNPLYEGLAGNIPFKIFEFEELRIKNIEREVLIRERTLSEAMLQLATQVAHDIRSPLAALESGLKDAQVTQGNKELINNALKRINSIAEDLLDKYRNKNKRESNQERSGQSYPDLDQIIEEVIKEKRKIYPDINFIFSKSGKDIKVNIDGNDISRIISNLINNGAEAIDYKKKGIIEVIIKKENGKAKIIVKDNGKGIPEDMINKLGEKGFTYGKEGGNGLGIWDAKNKIESAGGEIKISSKVNIGSEIEIILPSIYGKTIVLIDDDSLVRKNWEIEARRRNMAINTYSNPKDFLERIEEFPRDIFIYVDAELGEGLKGEEICKSIYEKGFENIYMETGHKEERFKDIVYIKGVIGKEFPY